MNSKTSNKPAVVTGVMAEFDRLQLVLTQTHDHIPSLIQSELDLNQQLGLAEVRGEDGADLVSQLQQTKLGKESAVRRRAAAAEGILELEGRLHTEKKRLEGERQQIAAKVIEEFQARYQRKVEELQMLWSEGEALERALVCKIQTPVPARLTPAPGGGLPTLERIRGNATAAIDSQVAELAGRIDLVDRALARVLGIKQHKDIEQRHFRLATERRQPAQMLGTYRVMSPITSGIDGMEFRLGTLVDEHLLGPGNLTRLVQCVRYLRPVGVETKSPAAA
jgi:hypothetical protein